MWAEEIHWPAVQAIGTIAGSVLAIGVAIWVSHRDRQAEERRFRAGVLGLADAVVRAARDLQATVENPGRLPGGTDFGWEERRIGALQTGLNEVSLSRMPSADAIHNFTRIVDGLGRLREVFASVVRGYQINENFPNHPRRDEAVEMIGTELQELEAARDALHKALA